MTTTERDILHRLHQLDPTGGEELVPWSTIRRHLTGHSWAQAEALQALVDQGEVVTVKIGGRVFVAICDGFCRDAEAAAAQRGERRVPVVL